MLKISLLLVAALSCVCLSNCHKTSLGSQTRQEHAIKVMQGFVDKVKGAVEAKVDEDFKEFKAVSYRSQLVHGMNYFVKVHVGKKEYIHIGIYFSYGGDVVLTGVQTGKTRTDKINYF